jgi:hypothetical protein
VKGELLDYRGIILYDLTASEKFAGITVAYNAFTNTKVTGETLALGIPH